MLLPEIFYALEKNLNKNVFDIFNAFPKISSKKTETGIEISADLPGLKKEEVNITIDKGILSISGERKEELKEEKNNYIMKEINYGTFSRSFSLGDKIDTENIEAEMENGVLKIKLKYKEKELIASKRIEIK